MGNSLSILFLHKNNDVYMTEFHSSCSRCVGRCFYCGGKTIKHGFTKGNKQKYQTYEDIENARN